MKMSYDERRKKEKGKSPMPSRPGYSRAGSLHWRFILKRPRELIRRHCVT
jgi:hypothetical protein